MSSKRYPEEFKIEAVKQIGLSALFTHFTAKARVIICCTSGVL
jgi:hypothetical protein